MQNYLPGQRWISGTESKMGLGTVLTVDHRTVTIAFEAIGEQRIYAQETAPLSRVQFVNGDSILAQDGAGLIIQRSTEDQGLITYHGINDSGEPVSLHESQLDPFLQLDRPAERLFSGQLDAGKWFNLRYQTIKHQHQLAHSDLYGLAGCRTSLIPHQLYIAHEVANRYAPRVLLADEVGLGKTIEAGLILHQQIRTERASRILIVVPETLMHQWLVEMLRRFNLYFSIFDASRYEALTAEDETEGMDEKTNPFQTEQLVLCSLDFLTNNDAALSDCLDGEWDLLVVDEAHHLQWSEENVSPEYQLIEQIAAKTLGVLLLTATPEQLGKASHFARLRLLDPDRFPDYASFLQEETDYEPVAQAVEMLLDEKPLGERELSQLLTVLHEEDNPLAEDILHHTDITPEKIVAEKTRLIDQLLDRHGTGRVLFRNTRATIQGFPPRQVNHYPLAIPKQYQVCLAQAADNIQADEVQLLLSPELVYQDITEPLIENWTDFDPRTEWLATTLETLRPEKVLVITTSMLSVLALAQALKVTTGIHAALFHEQLSIVERDRAAAWFADKDDGCQVLICSEIGSEGRNFQFAHHLVLFDLPANPDLLEQRIGRLDRIGQSQTIQIHVPVLQGTAQAIYYDWYHKGLNAFEMTCPAGASVYRKVSDQLYRSCLQPADDYSELIETTRKFYTDITATLQHGRDRLLEYSSCRPHVANTLAALAEQQDRISELPTYMDAIYDCFGVDSEFHSENCLIIRPGEHMVSHFPGLQEDGMTITYDRAIALSNEDMHFITWEHPLTITAMDMVLGQELGNSTVATIKHPGIKAGTLLLETLFVLEAVSGSNTQAERYLPPTLIRVLINENKQIFSSQLSVEAISAIAEKVDRDTAAKIVRIKEAALRDMLATSEKHASRKIPEELDKAREKIVQVLESEVERLTILSKTNRNVREDEIAFFKILERQIQQLLASAKLRVDALRVIVAT
ncbi:MAG: RNA polymerase-associated protein RapA [Gammaproteobacteria bacterium]